MENVKCKNKQKMKTEEQMNKKTEGIYVHKRKLKQI